MMPSVSRQERSGALFTRSVAPAGFISLRLCLSPSGVIARSPPSASQQAQHTVHFPAGPYLPVEGQHSDEFGCDALGIVSSPQEKMLGVLLPTDGLWN